MGNLEVMFVEINTKLKFSMISTIITEKINKGIMRLYGTILNDINRCGC